MGFNGVTITDDLDMGAIDKRFDPDTVVRRISEAEIDIALICHDRAKIEAAHLALLEVIRQSRDTRRKRVASVQRILDLKENYPGYRL